MWNKRSRTKKALITLRQPLSLTLAVTCKAAELSKEQLLTIKAETSIYAIKT